MAFISAFNRLSSASCSSSIRNRLFFFPTLRAFSSHRLNSRQHPLPSKPPKPDPLHPPPTRIRFLSLLSLAAAGALLAPEILPVAASCDPAVDRRVGGKDSTDVLVQGSHKEVPREFIDELRAICGSNMTLDEEERYFHGKPQNSFHKAVNVPDVVVYPISQDDVHRIVLTCNKYKIPIVPYGGATSIEGHTLAPNGGVCIDLSLMNKIKSLHVEDMDVIVEPGVGWIELNEYLKPYGLFFPLDPGPGATIGGMCATRCSGSLAVRYGTMRDNVINLHVVMANGDVIKTASRARKSAAGYDLTRLMIGSEGTLGIITEVTLRLQKLPQHSVVAMCHFRSIKDAADVAIATMHSGVQVSRMELLDEVQIRAINIANEQHLLETPTLMFEFIGTEAYSREQALLIQKIVSRHNGSDFVFVEDSDAKEELWKYLEEELGMGALMTMKRIKTALDPNNIMNPGKLIPPHVCL